MSPVSKCSIHFHDPSCNRDATAIISLTQLHCEGNRLWDVACLFHEALSNCRQHLVAEEEKLPHITKIMQMKSTTLQNDNHPRYVVIVVLWWDLIVVLSMFLHHSVRVLCVFRLRTLWTCWLHSTYSKNIGYLSSSVNYFPPSSVDLSGDVKKLLTRNVNWWKKKTNTIANLRIWKWTIFRMQFIIIKWLCLVNWWILQQKPLKCWLPKFEFIYRWSFQLKINKIKYTLITQVMKFYL